MQKQELKKYFTITASNFKFNLDEGFEILFEMIFLQTQKIKDEVIIKKFQQLWIMTAEEWNEKYRGWGGYPNLSQWLEILTGDRPKTDTELEKEQVEWQNKINYCISVIKHWLEDKNFDETYPQIAKYRNSNNQLMIDVVNKTYRCSTKIINDDEVKFLFSKIKADYIVDKQAWVEKMRAVAIALNPPPIATSAKIAQVENVVKLPILKRI